eukprot:SAG31_NODE_14424_length_807_cov_1.225989_1_plen_56_part_00
MAADHAKMDAQKAEMAKKRMNFLLGQADVFSKFLGPQVRRWSSGSRCSPMKLRLQ